MSAPTVTHLNMISPGVLGERVGKSRRWGRYAVQQNLVPSVRIGRLRYVAEEDAQRFAKAPPTIGPKVKKAP